MVKILWQTFSSRSVRRPDIWKRLCPKTRISPDRMTFRFRRVRRRRGSKPPFCCGSSSPRALPPPPEPPSTERHRSSSGREAGSTRAAS